MFCRCFAICCWTLRLVYAHSKRFNHTIVDRLAFVRSPSCCFSVFFFFLYFAAVIFVYFCFFIRNCINTHEIMWKWKDLLKLNDANMFVIQTNEKSLHSISVRLNLFVFFPRSSLFLGLTLWFIHSFIHLFSAKSFCLSVWILEWIVLLESAI